MNFHDMNDALKNAHETIRMADTRVGQMAAICAGRLRKADVPTSVLAKLKRELRDFDSRTGRWGANT